MARRKKQAFTPFYGEAGYLARNPISSLKDWEPRRRGIEKREAAKQAFGDLSLRQQRELEYSERRGSRDAPLMAEQKAMTGRRDLSGGISDDVGVKRMAQGAVSRARQEYRGGAAPTKAIAAAAPTAATVTQATSAAAAAKVARAQKIKSKMKSYA